MIETIVLLIGAAYFAFAVYSLISYGLANQRWFEAVGEREGVEPSLARGRLRPSLWLRNWGTVTELIRRRGFLAMFRNDPDPRIERLRLVAVRRFRRFLFVAAPLVVLWAVGMIVALIFLAVS